MSLFPFDGRDGGVADGAFHLAAYAGGPDGKGIAANMAEAGDGILFFRFRPGSD